MSELRKEALIVGLSSSSKLLTCLDYFYRLLTHPHSAWLPIFLAEKHCCKLFNVPQLGFCCIFKKQTNPYRGPQVESGIKSACFSKRCTGLRTIHLTTWIKTMTMMKKFMLVWGAHLFCQEQEQGWCKSWWPSTCRPSDATPSKMQLSK